jgi:hypothetical protein
MVQNTIPRGNGEETKFYLHILRFLVSIRPLGVLVPPRLVTASANTIPKIDSALHMSSHSHLVSVIPFGGITKNVNTAKAVL